MHHISNFKNNAAVIEYLAPVAVEEETKEPSVPTMVQEETKEEEPWLLTINQCFRVNDKGLLAKGESKAYTKETILRDLAEKIGAGNRLEKIDLSIMECNSYALTQLWTAFSTKIIDTGLKELTLFLM